MSDCSSPMEQVSSSSYTSSSSTVLSSPTSTAPSTAATDEEEAEEAHDEDDDEEEESILIPGCRLGRSGTIIRGVRADSPFPSGDDDDDDDVDGNMDSNLERSTKRTHDLGSVTARLAPRRYASLTKKCDVDGSKTQSHSLDPLGHGYGGTGHDGSIAESSARVRLLRSRYGRGLAGGSVRGRVGFGGADISVGVEHARDVKRIERKMAGWRGLVHRFARIKHEGKK